MTNSFGTTARQYPLVDARCVREHRERFRREAVAELEYANSYYSMSGRTPDAGWLLLDRASYALLDPYATDLRLVMSDFTNAPVTVDNLAVVHARCVTRGIAADPAAVYLIRVTNSQGVLYNPWFQFPTNSQYNVRVPGYDGKFYDWSMNGGSPWTWDAMVGNLWAQAPLQLGTYPHLPSTPDGTPENWMFPGTPLWDAIGTVLDHLGMSVSGGYPSYTIVTLGAADAALATLQARYAGSLVDDAEYLDGGSGRVPGRVVVYAHRRNAAYGTEETVRYDQQNWQSTPAYAVTVAAPAAHAAATGTGHIWTGETVRYDQEGNPMLADVMSFAAVARERVTQYYATIFRGTQGFMRQCYAGALPFTTGSLVDGVRWYNCGYGDEYCGWRTEVVRGFTWEEAVFPARLTGAEVLS